MSLGDAHYAAGDIASAEAAWLCAADILDLLRHRTPARSALSSPTPGGPAAAGDPVAALAKEKKPTRRFAMDSVSVNRDEIDALAQALDTGTLPATDLLRSLVTAIRAVSGDEESVTVSVEVVESLQDTFEAALTPERLPGRPAPDIRSHEGHEDHSLTPRHAHRPGVDAVHEPGPPVDPAGPAQGDRRRARVHGSTACEPRLRGAYRRGPLPYARRYARAAAWRLAILGRRVRRGGSRSRRPAVDECAGELSDLAGTWPEVRDRLLRTRDYDVPALLDSLVDSYPWQEVRVVGFSCTFQQNTASFALARRLKRAVPAPRHGLRRGQLRRRDGPGTRPLHRVHRLRRHRGGRCVLPGPAARAGRPAPTRQRCPGSSAGSASGLSDGGRDRRWQPR